MSDAVPSGTRKEVIERLHVSRAPKGTYARLMNPVQIALRNLDHVWGADVVDRMREVAEFLIVGDERSVDEVIAAAVAGKRAITRKKLELAIRNGAGELVRVALLNCAATSDSETGLPL